MGITLKETTDMPGGKPRATVQQLKLHGIEKKSRNHATYADPDVKDSLINEIPTPPSHYSARTKEAWNNIYKGLISMRVLTTNDVAALNSGFEAHEEMVKALRAIKEFEKEHKGPLDSNAIKDRKALSSWLLTSIAEANKVFCRFGLTPTERTRLNLIPEDKGPEDPLKAVLGN